MPGGDGTGPMGLGPMTGRRAGYCAGYAVPGYANPIPGRGWFAGIPARQGYGRGFGRGSGRGFGRRWAVRGNFYNSPYYGSPYPVEVDPKQEARMLRDQAKAMQDEVNSINERVKELESANESGADV